MTPMTEPVVERDVLFYPYVNFPSETWLKSALLFAPHVHRMVADGYRPRFDTPFMDELRFAQTQGGPLLQHAELWSGAAWEAQQALLARLQADIDREGAMFTD